MVQRVQTMLRAGLALTAGAYLVALPGAVRADDAPKKPTAAPRPDLTKGATLYVVGYSHLDTEWCWSYPQVIREFLPNTLHENFSLFEQYPDYIFNWTGANRYKMMKEYYPEDYARLKKYVAEGRWYPNGSSLEEGDVNIPSAESLIRQVMYGNQYFRREFGKAGDDYMLPDCFGFPASLPSILAHCGVKGFSTQKLTWGSAVGIPFNVGIWVGPDGTSIPCAFNPGSYTGGVEAGLSQSENWEKRITDEGQKSGVYVDYKYYGVGDRGGAPRPGDVERLEQSLKTPGPVHVISARADQMFQDLTPADIAKLPRYKGDLLLTQHSAGSLTSESAQKRWNRKNELLADDAEKVSVAADWLGALPYDRQRITEAWWRFLPGQFHDLMAGTALPKSYEFAWNDQIIAQNEFSGIVREGVGGVARALDTTAQGVPLVVYNPLSVAREDVVEATVSFPGAAPASVRVFGPDGKEVPAQVLDRAGSDLKILFLAKAPSIGFATYDVRRGAAPAAASSLKVTANSLENARYRVKLDANGDVASVFDKSVGHELLSGPARLAYQYENPSQYPAWNMDWDDQQKPPRGYVDGPAQVKIVEQGAVRVALQVTRYSEGSKFVQTIRLASGAAGDRVEFATRIDWIGKEAALKAVFPLTASNPQATYNWELGTIQRGNNDPKKYEVPSHQWFDLTDTTGKYGVSVLDDCKYGSDKPDDHTVRLTLIYTPGVRAGYAHQRNQDWGRHEMVYALAGHSGDWRQEQSRRSAARLNQPLLAFQAPSHIGALGMGRSFSLLDLSSSAVNVMALKKAEASDEIIVRVNELYGATASNVRLSMAAPILSAREVDGQERPLGKATVQNGKLVFSLSPYHVRAFALKLGKSPAHMAAPRSTPLVLPYNLDVASSGNGKTDGNFDGAGRSLPGELLPAKLTVDGVSFNLGSAMGSAKNAVSCQGQSIALPAGKNRRVYLLAASAQGDTPAIFKVGSRLVTRTIQSWSGYIGQWDNRLFEGQVPELTYGFSNPLAGLVRGYVKPAPVAWCADHRRLADGTNDPYAFSYLFQYSIDLPDDAKTLTLPRDAKVRIMAVTVAQNPNDDTRPAQPLSDTMEDRKENSGPSIAPPGGRYSDVVEAAVGRPFYWTERDTLRYTLDGSAPGASAASYSAPLLLSKSVTLKARNFDTQGKGGPVTAAQFQIHDTTPPSIRSAEVTSFAPDITVTFSEPVAKATAENTANYTLTPAATVKSATLSPDGRTVVLALGSSLPTDGAYKLTVAGVKDTSPAGNTVAGTAHDVTPLKPVFQLDEVQTFDGTGNGLTRRNVPGIPVGGKDPWTINFWAYTGQTPEELTILGGFGSGRDDNGANRFLIKYHDGIHFWGSSVDVSTGVPFDLGKWQMLTATFDGKTVRIYKNGQLLKSQDITLNAARPDVRLAPRGPWSEQGRFNGKIRGFTIWSHALSAESLQTLLAAAPQS